MSSIFYQIECIDVQDTHSTVSVSLLHDIYAHHFIISFNVFHMMMIENQINKSIFFEHKRLETCGVYA